MATGQNPLGREEQGEAGASFGYEYWNWKKNEAVHIRDFRDQAAVYVLYEGNDPATHRAIYVGETKRLFARLRKHARGQLWNRWQRFSWFGFYDVSKRDGGSVIYDDHTKQLHTDVKGALVMFEGMLIKLLESPLNMQRPRWPDATEYFQLIADGVEVGDDEDVDADE